MPKFGTAQTNADGGPKFGYPMDAGTALQIVQYLRSLPVVTNQVPDTMCPSSAPDGGTDAGSDAAGDAGGDAAVDATQAVVLSARMPRHGLRIGVRAASHRSRHRLFPKVWPAIERIHANAVEIPVY